MIIDGIEYIKKESNSPIKIVILQRGWVMIGRFEKDGSDCILRNAYNIRKWGATKGLGQLAIEGRQDKSILDRAGTVQFDYLTVVATINCDQEVWAEL